MHHVSFAGGSNIIYNSTKHAITPRATWALPAERVCTPPDKNQTQHVCASVPTEAEYVKRLSTWPILKSVTMSETGQGSTGDAGVTLKLSDRPKRTINDGSVENGTEAHPVRPRRTSYSWVVCFGIDDSTLCEQAFNWYLDNLHREGSYLVLINCVELPCLYSYQEVYAPAAMWQSTLRNEAEKTQQLEEKYVYKLKCHNIAGRYVIRDGKPGEGILKMATECDADMIVVGTRGLGKVRRTVLGSVSAYVIHHAHVPVIVCRPRGPHEHNDLGSKHSDGKKENELG